MYFGSAFNLVTIALYLLLLIPVCLLARKNSTLKNASDHYLADCSLGFFVLFLTLYATAFSGNIMGHCGQGYRLGFTWVMSAGLWAAISLGFHILVPKLRPLAVRNQFITPGDWVRFRFSQRSDALRILVAVVLILSLGNFLFAQLKAAGEILFIMTDGLVSYETGVLTFALIILTYDTLGGLRAVAWTDMIQGLIILVGFCCLVIWIAQVQGGLENIARQVSRIRPESAELPSTLIQVKWFSLMLLGGLSVIVYPQTLQRVFAASSDRVLHKSLAMMSVVSMLTCCVILFVGWTAVGILDLNLELQADQMLPKLLQIWSESGSFNQVAAILVMLAVLAAIMSTVDSVLLSIVSIIRHDVIQKTSRIGLKHDHRIAIILMGLMAILALYRDVSLWRLIELKLELLVQCVPTFIIALHWRKPGASAVLAGLISGLIFMFVALYSGITQFYGVNAGLVGLTLNIGVMCVYSYLESFKIRSATDSVKLH